ncbi:MAG: hypothetical protein QGI83_07905 [Candidatus Latescibacteria bacterium]|nr:hypothetical protein [Candidatus Latescibacterota bacterium]
MPVSPEEEVVHHRGKKDGKRVTKHQAKGNSSAIGKCDRFTRDARSSTVAQFVYAIDATAITRPNTSARTDADSASASGSSATRLCVSLTTPPSCWDSSASAHNHWLYH